MYHGGLLETHWGPLEATQYVPLRAIGDSLGTARGYSVCTTEGYWRLIGDR